MEKIDDPNSSRNEDESEKSYLNFKIIVLGNSGVGKSSLMGRASKNIFNEEYKSTIGFEFISFTEKIGEKNIKLQIWDTCGQETYKSLISNFYRNTSLAMLIYSIDCKESFDDIIKWIKEIKLQNNPDIKLFLIGNKADLENKREVSYEQGEKFKEENEIIFFQETSAKSGINAKEIFHEAAKILYEEYLSYFDKARNTDFRVASESSVNSTRLTIEYKPDKTKKKCC